MITPCYMPWFKCTPNVIPKDTKGKFDNNCGKFKNDVLLLFIFCNFKVGDKDDSKWENNILISDRR